MMSHGGWLETSIQTIMDARTQEENNTQSTDHRSLKTTIFIYLLLLFSISIDELITIILL